MPTSDGIASIPVIAVHVSDVISDNLVCRQDKYGSIVARMTHVIHIQGGPAKLKPTFVYLVVCLPQLR